MSIWIDEEFVLVGHQDLKRLGVDRRDYSLAENMNVFLRIAEPAIGREKGFGLAVCLRAGHDIERDPRAGLECSRVGVFDQNLEQTASADRANRKHPFGVFKTEPRSLSAGDQNNSDLSGGQSRVPAPPAMMPA